MEILFVILAVAMGAAAMALKQKQKEEEEAKYVDMHGKANIKLSNPASETNTQGR